ncbi:MAG: fatty acid--CoA ligase family protein [Candidatus Sumerlaeaceae bacterium]|nr:fatty acid--CoA ligase family protein [Candidatus Sumerlaeaceae bacterium]
MWALADLLSPRMLSSRGAKPAVVTPHGAWSYAALGELVEQRATILGSLGVEEGHAVLLMAAHSVETVADMLALLQVGAFQVPFSPELKPNEVSDLCERACAAWVITGADVKSVPANRMRYRTDGAKLGLLSSGSTGKPKLVLRAADHIAAGIQIYANAVNLTDADRILALLPLEHSYGFHNVVLATLAFGATLFFSPTPHPRLALQAIEEHNITILPAAPIFFELLVKFAGRGIEKLPLRAAISVGTALSRIIYEEFLARFKLPLWQSYGTSESGPVALSRRGTLHGNFLALGEVFPQVRVTIRADDGRILPEGDIGEIVVESPAVGLGYEGSAGQTGRFEGRLFFTGDRGFFSNGELYFTGRKKNLISAAGHKVDPVEVEEVLRQHPKIRDVAVLGTPDDNGIEQVTAYVCTSSPLTHGEVLAHCAERLAPFKLPRIIHFRDSLPRNRMGKLQLEKLQ